MADGDQHLRVGDQVFELDFIDLVHDLRAPVVAIVLLDFLQFADDYGLQLFLAGENFFQLGDALADGFQFPEDFIDGKLRQAVQLQFEDGIHLNGGQAAGNRARCFPFDSAELVLSSIQLDAFDLLGFSIFRYGGVLLGEKLEQVFLGLGTARRSPDDADYVIQMIEGHLIAGQNMFTLASLAQLEARASHLHVAAVVDEEPDELQNPHLFRLSAGDRQHDHAEGFLHLRVLVEIVENELRFLAALQLHHDAHAVAVAFIAHVRNAVDLLVLRQFGDALDERGLVDLVWNFRDDDCFAVLAGVFVRGLRALRYTSHYGLVRRFDAFAPGNVTACRKVRPGHQLHHFFQSRFRLLNHQHRGVNNFAQVVRRNVRGHADGDAAGAIDQQIRHARGKDGRLF